MILLAFEQSDQGLRCLHMPEDTLSHGAVYFMYEDLMEM